MDVLLTPVPLLSKVLRSPLSVSFPSPRPSKLYYGVGDGPGGGFRCGEAGGSVGHDKETRASAGAGGRAIHMQHGLDYIPVLVAAFMLAKLRAFGGVIGL